MQEAARKLKREHKQTQETLNKKKQPVEANSNSIASLQQQLDKLQDQRQTLQQELQEKDQAVQDLENKAPARPGVAELHGLRRARPSTRSFAAWARLHGSPVSLGSAHPSPLVDFVVFRLFGQKC